MADSLARKVAQIADECSYIQKDGRNDFHKYKYASAAAVLAKVNEAMVKHGVCSTVNPELLSESDNAGNRTVTVKVNLTLHDADSDQTLTTAGIGCGQDKGDKAVMKAQTAAIKYAWMLALNISTGDDPEADEDTDKRAHAPAPRQQPPIRGGAEPTRTEAAPASAGPQGTTGATPALAVTTPPPSDPVAGQAARMANPQEDRQPPEDAAPDRSQMRPKQRQACAVFEAATKGGLDAPSPLLNGTDEQYEHYVTEWRGAMAQQGARR